MKRDEDNLQRAVIGMLSLYENMGRLRYFAIPNGGKRSKIEAAIMKGLGTRAGIADLCILLPTAEGFGRAIFWELKSQGGKETPSQKEFLAWCNASGFEGVVIRSLDDAISELALHGIGVRKVA